MDFRIPLALTLALTLTACAGTTNQTEPEQAAAPENMVMEFSADSGQGYDHREARTPSSAATDSSECTAKRVKNHQGCVKPKALKAYK